MSEEILQKAINEAFNNEFEGYLSENANIFPSKSFDKKMRKLFKQSERSVSITVLPPKKLLLRVIAIIIAVLALTVAAVAFATNGFKFTRYDDYTSVLAASWENSPVSIKNVYHIEIPANFKLIDQTVSINVAYFNYRSDTGYIVFSQDVKKGYSGTVNTEGYEKESVTVNGHIGFFIQFENECLLMWDNDDYILMLTSTLPKDEVFNLAETAKY